MRKFPRTSHAPSQDGSQRHLIQRRRHAAGLHRNPVTECARDVGGAHDRTRASLEPMGFSAHSPQGERQGEKSVQHRLESNRAITAAGCVLENHRGPSHMKEASKSKRLRAPAICAWGAFIACLPACDEVDRCVVRHYLKPCYDECIGGISGCPPLISAPDSAAHKPNRRGRRADTCLRAGSRGTRQVDVQRSQ